jgi:hypothetical protein
VWGLQRQANGFVGETPVSRWNKPEHIQRRLNAGDAKIYFFLDENK